MSHYITNCGWPLYQSPSKRTACSGGKSPTNLWMIIHGTLNQVLTLWRPWNSSTNVSIQSCKSLPPPTHAQWSYTVGRKAFVSWNNQYDPFKAGWRMCRHVSFPGKRGLYFLRNARERSAAWNDTIKLKAGGGKGNIHSCTEIKLTKI